MTKIALADLAGYDLGQRAVSYGDRDVILYALAVGAAPTDLELVYEQDLRALPTFATTLGLWAVEAAGELGAYDRTRSLHVSQRLQVLRTLPPQGEFVTTGRITNVWDKTKAAMVDIDVESDYFTASYSIFLPGLGGWGGRRGPSATTEPLQPAWTTSNITAKNQAALYRLTGDRHPIHIDPETAKANRFDQPILHGLCTLGITARLVADAIGAHPAALIGLDARLAAPVVPGDTIQVEAQTLDANTAAFQARTGETLTITNGRAVFQDALPMP